jgi:hypothetical protein
MRLSSCQDEVFHWLNAIPFLSRLSFSQSLVGEVHTLDAVSFVPKQMTMGGLRVVQVKVWLGLGFGL